VKSSNLPQHGLDGHGRQDLGKQAKDVSLEDGDRGRGSTERGSIGDRQAFFWAEYEGRDVMCLQTLCATHDSWFLETVYGCLRNETSQPMPGESWFRHIKEMLLTCDRSHRHLDGHIEHRQRKRAKRLKVLGEESGGVSSGHQQNKLGKVFQTGERSPEALMVPRRGTTGVMERLSKLSKPSSTSILTAE
jgi:hypothetical protein